MEARIIKIGTSVGMIIPRYIVVEGGFTQGTVVNIEFKDEELIVKKKNRVRQGWEAAFAQYSKEGEDELLLPDFIDSEAIDLI